MIKQQLYIDKNSLFDGVSMERLILCVKTKAITRCRTMYCASFERKLREGDQEEPARLARAWPGSAARE